MKLSVIIPCFNSARTIGAQLESLANQSCADPWQVIVSDNGSSDESVRIVERYARRLPGLHIVDSSDRRGAAHARNAGAQAAHADALAFCDADDEVAPGWVAAMLQGLAKYDFVAGRFELDKLNPPWIRFRHAQQTGLDRFRHPPYLACAGAGNLGIKRAVHEAVDGFDESVLALEDTDYCFRVQLAGTRLHFLPDAIVHVRMFQGFGSIYGKALANGEAHILLYKKYRAFGMPKASFKSGLSGWLHLVRLLPGLRTKAQVALWVWSLGWRAGRLRGYVKYWRFMGTPFLPTSTTPFARAGGL